jgi:hypothetical protein
MRVAGIKNVSSEWQPFLTTGNECEGMHALPL